MLPEVCRGDLHMFQQCSCVHLVLSFETPQDANSRPSPKVETAKQGFAVHPIMIAYRTGQFVGQVTTCWLRF